MEERVGGNFQQVNGDYVWTAGSSLSLLKFFQHFSVNMCYLIKNTFSVHHLGGESFKIASGEGWEG